MINAEELTKEEFCLLFDHTLLAPDATEKQMLEFCQEALAARFAMVAVNSMQVARCKEIVKDNVHVGAAISFPLGQTTIPVKTFETTQAIHEGVDEIDYVINIGEVKNENFTYIRKEMEAIVAICRENAVVSKVIFENCYLSQNEIAKLLTIANQVKPDFVKTSTGFGPDGAKVQDVAFMRKSLDAEIKVKAAGGIRSWAVCKAMIDAGAERIGSSRCPEIVREWAQR